MLTIASNKVLGSGQRFAGFGQVPALSITDEELTFFESVNLANVGTIDVCEVQSFDVFMRQQLGTFIHRIPR